MKYYRSEEYVQMKNPTPGEIYRNQILTAEHNARNLGGIVGVLPPGQQGAYHYHNNRESIIIAISGEAVEIYEGKEYPIKAGDVLFIPPAVKHTTANRSNKEFRYLEFFTHPPARSDFVEVEYKKN